MKKKTSLKKVSKLHIKFITFQKINKNRFLLFIKLLIHAT